MHLDLKRVVDIELTNRCNATCSFCPREKTPKQGFMAYETFEKSVSRVLEMGSDAAVSLTGLGEPMLHPRFLDCIRHLAERGLSPSFTTNASRLFREQSEALLDAGLKRIDFSVSDLGDDYKKVYNLDFATTRRNIADFMAVNNGRCHVQVSIVRHDDNIDTIDAMVEYWKAAGVDHVNLIREINRGGSCSREYYFQRSDQYKQQAEEALSKAGLTRTCSLPFLSIFIGWNGNYYLCCMDWEKTVPLKTVFDTSLHELDVLKYHYLQKPSALCSNCSAHPVNSLCETFHEVANGKRGKFAVAHRINAAKTGAHHEFTNALKQWEKSHNSIIGTDQENSRTLCQNG